MRRGACAIFVAWILVAAPAWSQGDYVPLAGVAARFDLGTPAAAGLKKFACSGKGGSAQVEIDSREAVINGIRQWLSFPARLQNGAPAVAEFDVRHTIAPALQPGKVPGLRRRVKTVVLDAGHGGYDNGASSRFGFEKEFTLDVARRVRKKLEAAGFKVVQTRNSDTFIDLERRPRVANKLAGAVFVSIHFNSADWKPSANGIETYAIAPLGAPPSGQDTVMARDRRAETGHALELVNLSMANTMQQALMARLKVEDRGVKRARFVVLKDAATPAILIEGGFLTNPAEAARIASPAWRESYAAAIAAGVLAFKNLAEKAEPSDGKGG